MKRSLFLLSSLLGIGAIFLLTCGVDPISLHNDTGAPHAFVSDSVVNNPSLQDTSFFSKCDTVHAGDSLTFFGAVIPIDTRVKDIQWDFADGKQDSHPFVKHAYEKGGIYHAKFSIYDSVGNFLSDSVVVCVNTPPDSVNLLSPADGAVLQSLFPHLEWKGYDRDDFDSALVYMVIFLSENGTTDTVVKWSDTTKWDITALKTVKKLPGLCLRKTSLER